MWKLLAIGLSVLRTVQAIPHHPAFFHHRNQLDAEVGFETGASSDGVISTAATVVYPETVTVRYLIAPVASLALYRAPVTKT